MQIMADGRRNNMGVWRAARLGVLNYMTEGPDDNENSNNY